MADTVYLCEKPSQAHDIARILGATNKTQHYLSGNGVTVTWCFGHLLKMASPDRYGDEYKKWALEALPIIPEQWRLDVRPKVKAQYKVIADLVAKTGHVVVDRDHEIESFKPVPYWDLVARLATGAGDRFDAQWQLPVNVADDKGRCLDEYTARRMAQQIEGATARITAAETNREHIAPPLPYDLGMLQQDASKTADMGAQAVLDTAQSLYETHKVVTYPRTDCRYLPISMFDEAATVLDAMGRTDPAVTTAIELADPQCRSKAWNDKKITAHHAIIPTTKPADLGRMSAVERRLYEMIRTRYLIQFCDDYEYDRTILSIDIAGATFRATGKVVVVDGWKAVTGPDADDDDKADNARLPIVAEGETCRVAGTENQAKQTRPPSHYTEGTLIAAMKNVASMVTDHRLRKILKDTAGLGTEATRAGIIATLIDRGFLAKEKKKILSTDAGRALISILPCAITNPGTTAAWEQALDEISAGRMTLENFVARQVKWVRQAIDQVQQRGLNVLQGVEPKAQKKCPACGKPMRKRTSKYGSFWGCTGYPDCTVIVQTGGKRRRKKAAEE